jgi:uncharacterized protein YqeY
MLRDKIQQDQISALKARDEKRLSVLRFLLADVRNEEINKHKELSDDEVVSIIRKQVKKLDDTAEMFTKGGRPDLVTNNKEQVVILTAYLPAELSDEDLKAKVESIIAENKDLFESNRSAVIGILMGKLKSEASPQRIMTIFNSIP